MRAMKAPEPGHLMMQAMIPVLCQVIGHRDDKEAPPKRHPGEYSFLVRQQPGQRPEGEIDDSRTDQHFGAYEANRVQYLLIFCPAPVIETEQKFRQADGEGNGGQPPTAEISQYRSQKGQYRFCRAMEPGPLAGDPASGE